MKKLLQLKNIIIFIFIFVFLCSFNASGKSILKMNFIPFDVQTYIPVTKQTIESHAFETCTTFSKHKIYELTKLLKNGIKSDDLYDWNIDHANIRAKIIINKSKYFIDIDGVVFDGKIAMKINKNNVINFKKSLYCSVRVH